MKDIVRVLTAALAATLLAGGGKAVAAGGSMAGGPESPGNGKPGVSSPLAAGPAYGTFEYEEALETGKLPATGARAFDSALGMTPDDRVPAVEVGGRTYRVGIDTQ